MNNSISIAVIQFPGTNTERETLMAIERAGMQAVEFLWNDSYKILKEFDGYIIAGGFSYEDRSRAGIIASLDPIIDIIKKQSELGKPVLGICNGAQILVESGMVPGLENYKLGMALTDNKRTKDGHVLGTGYYNNWANLVLSVPKNRTAFTCNLERGNPINIPFAHAEGRFIIEDIFLDELIQNEQTVFRYGDANGNIVEGFPTNPNGSTYNLAAVCNPTGNIMAIMPHPERTKNGDAIFTSMRDYILNRNISDSKPLKYSPNNNKIRSFNSDDYSIQWYIESIITDNEAVSVQNALVHLKIPVITKKLNFWNIILNNNDSTNSLENIDKSGELYNSNKERLIKFERQPNSKYFLVCPKEDLVGRYKTEILKHHFKLNNLNNITSGVIWQLQSEQFENDNAITRALETNIFFNPFSHNCYEI